MVLPDSIRIWGPNIGWNDTTLIPSRRRSSLTARRWVLRLHISAITPDGRWVAISARMAGQLLMGTATKTMIRVAGGRQGIHLVAEALSRRRIEDPDPVSLAEQEAGDPLAHAALAADDQSVEGVAPVDRVAGGGLFLDRLFDQKQGEVAAEGRLEAEETAGLLEPVVNLGLHLEVAQGNPEAVLELADLARQLEAFAHQVEDPPVEGLDVTPVLLEQPF